MELTSKIKEKIKEHALSLPEEEVAGLILSNGMVIRCINRATDKMVHFIIASGDISKARKKGEIAAVYHSHVPGNYGEDRFSENDEVIAEYFKVKAVLYSMKDDKFYEYQPTGKPITYLNRPYIRNIMDEFDLIRDYYKKELNIEITELHNKNIEIFLKENGFVEVGELKKHDILIIKWQNNVNKRQMVLYVGNNKIIVHPEFETSRIADYNYGLKNWTEKIFRHNKM